MILCMAAVLTAAEVERLRAVLDRGPFVDGRATAGWHAAQVKRNLQLAGAADRAADALVLEALARNEVFQLGVRPRTIRPPLFSRYENGMAYGTHVDDPVMGPPEAPVRTDVALTLFISAPEDYAGGELVLEGTAGEQAIKLPAGAAVAYPANTLHRVEPVTRGRREVAVTWIQSQVREPERREVLFDLDTLRREEFAARGKTRAFDLLSKTHANLLRAWAEL